MTLCECGCGDPAPLAKANDPRKGHVKGQPVRYISGHNSRVMTRTPEHRRKISEYSRNRPIEHHLKLVDARRSRPLSEEISAGSLHQWLSSNYPKQGRCEECGKARKTTYSYLHHPKRHTRNRDDYRELCMSCHVRFDFENGTRKRENMRREAA